MNIALLSDANTPGPFHHAVNPCGWQVNGVEALAWALDGEVWHGTEICDLAVEHFQRLDALIVNMKHTLWNVIPALCNRLRGDVKLCDYQEGSSDILLSLDTLSLELAIRAHSALDTFCVFDQAASPFYQYCVTNVHLLQLPAPVGVYERHRVPRDGRPSDPPRVCVGQPFGAGRGAWCATRQALVDYPGAIVVAYATDMYSMARAARWITDAGGVPDLAGWVEWAPPIQTAIHRCAECGHQRTTTTERSHPSGSFLTRLAQCVAGYDADPRRMYGRFIVDCIGLDVDVHADQSRTMMASDWNTALRAGWERNHTPESIRAQFEEVV